MLFSDRDKIRKACFDPGSFVGPRIQTDGGYEDMDNWRARAVLEAIFQLAVESPAFVDAINRRRSRGGKYEEHTIIIGAVHAISKESNHDG